MAVLAPTSAAEVEELVRRAAHDATPLQLCGGDSKSALGRRLGDEIPKLHLCELSGIVSYEPAELILVTRPGLGLAEAEATLAANGQQFAFEPPHVGPSATIGGMVSSGLSGPRRFKIGGVRDFVLGVEFVDGHGKRVRAGGRVVKNVTGYDLPRTVTGAFGTLGVLTEICLKLWPMPETAATMVIDEVSLTDAADRMLEWARLPLEISGLAFVPRRSASGPPGTSGKLLVRIEGTRRAVSVQFCELEATLPNNALAQLERLDDEDSASLWRQLREFELCARAAGEQLWRLCLPPGAVARLVEDLVAAGLRHYSLDWGGGLLWALFPAGLDALVIHRLAGAVGATSWRLATGVDDDNDAAFTPLTPVEEGVHRRLKTALDPESILNPGRMYDW